ncbi:hypothetical protein [Streptomyces zagrosensis]|uniref:Uncharacterized protein n=1 Tax=Streptomyces zagrosensis TaxID=1042984 RepID=A0A7W9Q869_9ACTN|nr:hypothetical protein [Streptomyces zagrosensis]MBB5935154.1 hypothetical protein [Streptomyces zagrosensis]
MSAISTVADSTQPTAPAARAAGAVEGANTTGRAGASAEPGLRARGRAVAWREPVAPSWYELGERLAHGFLPARPPVRAMIGTWVQLDALAAEVALAPSQAAARALVARAEQAGELHALRVRVARLTPRNAEAAAMRVAVLTLACGWAHLDPMSPVHDAEVNAGLVELWSVLAHRLDHPNFVALPALALHNWAPARKPRRHLPIDQLARVERLVPVVRWSPKGEPLSRLDHFMLATTRLEARGVWLFRLAETLAHTLADLGPDAPATATALRRLARVLHTLRAQLAAEQRVVEAARVTDQQRTALAALVRAAAPGRRGGPAAGAGPGRVTDHGALPRVAAARPGGLLPGTLEPPVIQAAEAALGMGAYRLGESGRQSGRRHLPAAQRAWLTALERHCAPVRGLGTRGGPAAAAYHEARTSLITLRHSYAHLLHTAQALPPPSRAREVA